MRVLTLLVRLLAWCALGYSLAGFYAAFKYASLPLTGAAASALVVSVTCLFITGVLGNDPR